MRKELRIPTLIAVVALLLGLGATAFATNFAQSLFTKASVSASPREVKVSNISDTSFSVSWITDESVSGAVVYKTTVQGYGQPVLDDRVQGVVGTNDKFYTHHVSLRFLKPATAYTFKIISGTQEYSDSKYTLTTPIKSAEEKTTVPAYGIVERSPGIPLSGGIVYVTVNNSTLLSSLSKSSGSWLVSLNTARTADLSSLINFNNQGDPINIFVQAGKDGVAQAKTVTGKEAPVANIALGKNYDFSTEAVKTQNPTSTPTPTAGKTAEQEAVTPTETPKTFGNTQTETVAKGTEITIPAKDATLTDSKPTFEGSAEPGQLVRITVESEQKYSASVVAGETGKWSWTSPANLEPGQHTVTMTVKDSTGKEQVVKHNFLVLASGTSVVESATPSATFTPTPTLEPEPSASPSPIPVSGDLTPTIGMLLFSLALIIVSGVVFYSASLKNN